MSAREAMSPSKGTMPAPSKTLDFYLICTCESTDTRNTHPPSPTDAGALRSFRTTLNKVFDPSSGSVIESGTRTLTRFFTKKSRRLFSLPRSMATGVFQLSTHLPKEE